MDRFARIVLGYHGCVEPFASNILTGKLSVSNWRESIKTPWLGNGIYFWEHAPERALRWAGGKAQRNGRGETPAVIGAVIQLGRCFDLTSEIYTKTLSVAHGHIREMYIEKQTDLPRNGTTKKRLDCLVINWALEAFRDANIFFDTVRSPFLYGKPVYENTNILDESHIQIAIREKNCILGVFRPNL